MGLQRQRARREPGRSAAPQARAVPRRAAGEALRFVIRKHGTVAPSFELRLELDGVVKSWAMPRDPDTDPSQRRVAVHTEDHPIEDAEFRGSVAEDVSGTNTNLWDGGTWIPEGSPLASYRRGHLDFELKGRRMKGRWALVRVGNASTRKKDLWLLVKRDDGA